MRVKYTSGRKFDNHVYPVVAQLGRDSEDNRSNKKISNVEIKRIT